MEIKLLNNSYLYNKFPKYEKVLFNYLMSAHIIDKNDESFDDIRYEVKRRQVADCLIKVLDNDKVVLLTGTIVPKQFHVMIAKDLKNNPKQYKIFINCEGIISYANGKYNFKRIDILIAYLVQAMVCLLYGSTNASSLISNSQLTQYGAECYAKLFTTVVDYIFKISVTGNLKAQCMYLAAMFYQVHLLGKDNINTAEAVARKISGLSERESDIVNLYIKNNSFLNIKHFVETVAETLKINLTLDIVVDKWMYLYDTGTVLALELFTFFSGMITNAYIGCYLNNQKTIENQCKTSMVGFSKEILAVGSRML